MTTFRSFIPAILLSTSLCLAPFTQGGVALGAVAPSVAPLAGISEGTSTPVRLAGDQFGNLYVADPRGGGILKFNSAGKLQKTIPSASPALGIAIAQGGNLLVSQGSYVAVLDPASGAQLSQFGSFLKANGIAVDGGGFVYVTDSLNNCVQVFNQAYAPVSTGTAAVGMPANSFGSKGLATGQFLQPSGISFERISRQLAVADTLNGRIQFFSTAGVYQSSLGSFGSGPLQFTSPQGIAFEYTQNGSSLSRIYVVDTFQSNVQVIDAASAAFLRNIGSYGTSSGKLVLPSDLLYDQFDALHNRLVVANGTGTLALFAIDQAGAPAPAGPALTINSVPLATNMTTLAISGSTAAGASVTVNGAAVAVNGTSWNATVTLVTGINVITVVASDPSGTTTGTATVNAVGSGSTLPQVSLALAPISSLTSSTPITLSGSVTAGATVQVNGVAASVNGTTWSLPVNLTSGANSFQIVASKSGFADSSESFNITLDGSVPVLTALLLQNNATTATPVQTVSGTVNDSAASSVVISLNGSLQTVPVLNGSFSSSVALAYGVNTLTVTAQDAGGNSSDTLVRTINYDPQGPALSVTTPNGTVSTSAGFTLTGSAATGSLVTVNGLPTSAIPATPGAPAGWSFSATLAPGVNYFEVKASDPVSGKSSSTAQTVSFNAGMPQIAVQNPLLDLATATRSLTVTGTLTPGATATASLNGISLPIAVASSGAFTLNLPAFPAPGSYAIVISATDSAGNTSSVTRTVIYDPSVPGITVVSESPLKVSVTGGVLVAKDKNGPVGTVVRTGTGFTLDLTGVSYDRGSLNIYGVTAAGTSTRNGDLDGSGAVGVSDALKALQIAVGLTTATAADLLRGDVGPLVGGAPAPDGVIDSRDALILLRAAVGLINLY